MTGPSGALRFAPAGVDPAATGLSRAGWTAGEDVLLVGLTLPPDLDGDVDGDDADDDADADEGGGEVDRLDAGFAEGENHPGEPTNVDGPGVLAFGAPPPIVRSGGSPAESGRSSAWRGAGAVERARLEIA